MQMLLDPGAYRKMPKSILKSVIRRSQSLILSGIVTASLQKVHKSVKLILQKKYIQMFKRHDFLIFYFDIVESESYQSEILS